MPGCRDAKLLQVLRRQAREDGFINLVLAEDLLVPSEAKAPQPNHYVHDDAPAGRNGYALSLASKAHSAQRNHTTTTRALSRDLWGRRLLSSALTTLLGC